MEECNFTDGQTPLEDDEREGLRIKSITTRDELDEFEQQNIEKAIEWTLKRKFKQEEIFSEEFVRNLHRKMYSDVWRWAGEFRRTEKNIGIDPAHISVSLNQLNGNCLHWIEKKIFPADEIAIRYKHELVKIHCFANGNGRHSRLMADIVVSNVFGKAVFNWGNTNLIKQNESRQNYLHALRQADENNFKALLEFARFG